MNIRRVSSTRRIKRNSESGVALIMALLALLIVTTLAAGLMSTTQSEIWTTSNYRGATAARYAAEAGVQRAAYFIKTWTPPASLSGSSFQLADLPVTYYKSGSTSCAVTPANCIVMAPSDSNGNPLIAGVTDTYSAIDSTTDSTFNSTVNSSTTSSPFPGITGNPKYLVAVQLLSAKYDSQAGWITTWKIISQGTVSGVRSSKVQVVATIENKIVSGSGTGTVSVPSFKYGAWANSTACSAIEISGGSNSESYNSSTQSGVTNPTLSQANGDIATLGNVYLHNSAMVYGNIFAPNYNLGDPSAQKNGVSNYYPYGVSGGPTWPYWNAPNATPESCSSTWPYAVNMDNSGGNGFGCTSSACVDKASKLPTGAAAYPSATLPAGAPTTNNTSTCNYNTACAGNYGSGSMTFPPTNTSYGQVTLGSNDDYYFSAGNYYFDTLTITASARIHLTSTPVVIYILNGANSTQPLNFTGGQQTNQGGNPNDLSFVYNGTQTVHIGNISSNALFGTIYAPNANVKFDGNGNIFGAVIGNTVSITGGGHLNYDTNLANSTPHIYTTTTTTNVASSFHFTEFSWSAF